MRALDRLGKWAVASSMGIILFGVPHLIDDFLFDVPAEFGIGEPIAQALGGVFFSLVVFFQLGAERGTKWGFAGLMAISDLLIAAILLKHVEGMIAPAPYWSGWFSEALIIGLGLACLFTSVFASFAFVRSAQQSS